MKCEFDGDIYDDSKRQLLPSHPRKGFECQHIVFIELTLLIINY